MASVSFLLVDQMFHVLKHSPDHSVCADDELRPWVPLVVGDIVVSLKPDPLLTFSQETVIARLPLPYCITAEREISYYYKVKTENSATHS